VSIRASAGITSTIVYVQCGACSGASVSVGAGQLAVATVSIITGDSSLGSYTVALQSLNTAAALNLIMAFRRGGVAVFVGGTSALGLGAAVATKSNVDGV
jgi:hypothetical protein